MEKININKGLLLSNPNTSIFWNMCKRDLMKIFGDNYKKINFTYCSGKAILFTNINAVLAFTTLPFLGIRKIEVLRDREYYSTHSLKESFTEFQEKLIEHFGEPTKVIYSTDKSYDDGYPRYIWIFKKIIIEHYVFERFGFGEYLIIRKSLKKNYK